ncbi:hypothetical protein Zmor_000101 [Zophobas morio]|uniref:Reverse transcriptase domain-containing protein n=1 Tax=Zophobas morio TaxID=2755281 RepID=A0AA38MHT7_9CUCU|nr:hypothetical protein Zmor_015705 [Zophobas morio]KAJ3664543.1 hypothetical protein Zmor_000101 [Zophobas morio]
MPEVNWMSCLSNPRSTSEQLLVKLLQNSHLVQMVNQPTRYRQNQDPSRLDLILSSDENLFTNIQYLDPIGKSDHVVISGQLQLCYKVIPRTVVKNKSVINFVEVNSEFANLDWTSILTNSNILENWAVFKITFNTVVAKHTVIFTSKKSGTKPWINSRILKMVKEKRRLWKIYKRSRNQSDYVSHRTYSNRLSNTIKKARISFENNVANSKDPKLLYKYIRSSINGLAETPQLKNHNGDLITDNYVTAEVFADSFSANYLVEPPIHSSLTSDSIVHSSILMDVEFSEDNISKKINSLKENTSPGPDGLSATMLRNCAQSLCKPLSILMTQSFKSGSLPSDWKLANVKPIYKKGDKYCATNYRPISLTSLVVKMMESIICDSLRAFLNQQNVIPTEQHGFVSGRSTTTNLLSCVNDWTKNFDRGIPTDVIYFDFAKAFDRVPIQRLILKLKWLGVSGNLLVWIKSFLSERLFRVKVGEVVSGHKQVISGVPQGSVLGPLLFLVYTADLRKHIRSPCAFYADDFKIYNSSCKLNVIATDILAVTEWSKKWLIPLNISKCVVLHIGPHNPRADYFIYGVPLTKVDAQNDLGVTITTDLTWSQHIAKIVSKANKMVYLLRRTFKNPDHDTVAKLHKTYVRPILEYSNLVWYPILVRDSDLLEGVQRRMTRLPYGILRPSYEQRLVIMKCPALGQRRTRGDAIATFIALILNVPPTNSMFTLNSDVRTRGHQFKLLKEAFRTRTRQFFFSNRIFDTWNSLPLQVVCSPSVLSFKKNFDHFMNM